MTRPTTTPNPRVAYRNVTSDEVLRYLRAAHWARVANAEALPEDLPTREQRVRAWKRAWELCSARQFFEESFDVRLGSTEWIETASWRGATVGDLCDLVARVARVPDVRPATILGVADLKAGAFLTVKALLAESGCDVSRLAPSVSLHPYVERASAGLGPVLSRLAPHAAFCAEQPAGSSGGVVLAYLSVVPVLPALMHAAASCGVFFWLTLAAVLLFWLTRHLWPGGDQPEPPIIRFPELRTFRDLSTAIAREWLPTTPPRCVRCGYSLRGLAPGRCPECGEAFSAADFGLSEAAWRRWASAAAAT